MKYKNLPKWQKKLTASDRKHLKESGGLTLAALKRNLRANVDEVNKGANSNPLCWDCWFIGQRLGLIGEEPQHTVPHKYVLL